jgi:hypothetical protein
VDIQISNEQIQAIAEKQIINIIRPKVEEVLKDKYWSRQSLSEEIQECIHKVVLEKVDSKLTDDKLLKIIENQNLVEHLSQILVKAVSTNLMQKLLKSLD